MWESALRGRVRPLNRPNRPLPADPPSTPARRRDPGARRSSVTTSPRQSLTCQTSCPQMLRLHYLHVITRTRVDHTPLTAALYRRGRAALATAPFACRLGRANTAASKNYLSKNYSSVV